MFKKAHFHDFIVHIELGEALVCDTQLLLHLPSRSLCIFEVKMSVFEVFSELLVLAEYSILQLLTIQ